MGSSAFTALFRGLLLLAAGAGLALAWQAGLYASALVASLAGLWGVAMAVVHARQPRPSPPPQAAPVPPPGQGERRLTALLDVSPAPFVTLDGGGRLHAINRAARRLFGAADFVADPPPSLIQAIAADGTTRAATVVIAGRSYALATSDFALGGAQSRLAALIDIDAELKAAEAATLRDLVQVLSHEIVNALTPIASLSRTAADMLEDAAPPLPALREAVGTVARRAAGLQRFGESYRALARLPAPVRQQMSARELGEDMARLFATRWPGISLQLEVRDALPLHADPDQLNAALWALLQNAAEAVDDRAGGAVSLRIDMGAGETLVRVADNGPGIDAADRDAIFRPFLTTKPQGTGVGLALARQIFLAHGGDLRLDPSGEGAAFLGWIA